MLKAGLFAQTQTFRDFQYVVQDFDASPAVTITRYIGSAQTVAVPDEINRLPVAAISAGAFERCTGLVSVSLPAGLTVIGDAAFALCPSLTAIAVDPGNPAYAGKDGVLFNKSGAELVSYPPGKTAETSFYIIPEGVTAIRNFAFYGCTGLVSVSLPAGLAVIGDAAFARCTSLKRITIPASVTSVGDAAFYGCTSLAELNLPRNAAVGMKEPSSNSELAYTLSADENPVIGANAIPAGKNQAGGKNGKPSAAVQTLTASEQTAPSAKADSADPQPAREKSASPRFTALIADAGTSFAAPWLIGSLGFAFAPLDNFFVWIGFDAGLLSGIPGADYLSLYPYAHAGYFSPVTQWLSWYAAAGGGYMFQTWTFETGTVKNDTPAADIAAGAVLWNHLDISYTLRTNFSSVNHKLSVGFIYRFHKKQ